MNYKDFPEKVQILIEEFTKNQFEIAVVGGAVRNLILDHKVKDWDFTTNATPEEILKMFEGYYDNDYGTVRVKIDNDIFEVTTYRSEHGYSDGRRPDKVIWGETLEEDLSRRDFTVNAIAIKFVNKKPEIVDPFDGRKDLKGRLIRSVGNPTERFREDGLRVLRAVRFAIQLNFNIEKNTFESLKDERFMLLKIANERIRDEFLKICSSCDSYEHFMLMWNTEIVEIILPELAKCFGVEQKSQKRHHQYDVWKHNVMSMILCPSKDPVVKLAALLHDIGKPLVADITEEGVRTFYNHDLVGAQIARNICSRWNMSKMDTTRVVKLVRWHLFSVNEFQTDKAVRRLIRNVGNENVSDLMDVRIGDRLGSGSTRESWRLRKFKERLAEVSKTNFEIKDLKVDGHDVMKIFDLQPGPEIRKVLTDVFEKVDSDEIKNDRESLIEYLELLKSSNFLGNNQ